MTTSGMHRRPFEGRHLVRTKIAKTNELAEESLKGVSRGALLPDDPRCQRAWDLPVDRRDWKIMLREVNQVSIASLLTAAQKESGLGSIY